MENLIHLSGIADTPGPYSAPEGQLSIAVNLAAENNELVPIPAPARLFDIPDNAFVYIHTPSGLSRRFLVFQKNDNGQGLSVTDSDGSVMQTLQLPVAEDITDCAALGNIIIISSKSGMSYLFFDPATLSYRSLGSKLPDVKMSFALHGDIVSRSFDADDLELIKSSQIQTIDNDSWSNLIARNVVDEPLFPKVMAGPEVNVKSENVDRNEYPNRVSKIYIIPDISLVKNNEYKISISGISGIGNYNKVFLRIFEYVDKDNIIDFNNYIAETDGTTTFVAQRDYAHLAFCVFVLASHNTSISGSSISCSFSVSKSEITHVQVEHDVIKYSKESYQIVAAAVNKFIAEEGAAKNRFIFPFFVRYALRLFDGSNVMASPPILMIPNSDYVPLIFFKNSKPKLNLAALTAELAFRFDDISSLPEWEGIVDGIDIFVSPSAWPYNQALDFDPLQENFSYTPFDNINSFGFMSVNHQGCHVAVTSKIYLKELAARFCDTESFAPSVLAIGRRSEKEFLADISATSTFYRVKSLSFDDCHISQQFANLDLEGKTLQNLLVLPQMPQAILPYSGFAHPSLHVYNSRLHIFNSSVIPPSPVFLASCNGCSREMTAYDSEIEYIVWVFLRTDAGVRAVNLYFLSDRDFGGDAEADDPNFRWFFYPDRRAFQVMIIRNDDPANGDWESSRRISFSLRPHDFLNGAYALVDSLDKSELGNGWFKVPADAVPDELLSAEAAVIPAPGSIYVSEVNNPFAFNAAAVVSIPASVVSLASATQALSQGQFGQFPLYAFTGDGIWAMELGSAGTYIARQPLSRHIVQSPDSICPLDDSVLFVSPSGVHLLAGSNVKCLSPQLAAPMPDIDTDSLPAFNKMMSIAGWTETRNLSFTFTESINPCRILYDYRNRRIFFSSTSLDFSFVLSLRSGLWSMSDYVFNRPLNSYPDAVAIVGNALVSFSDTDKSQASIPFLILTRPLKFESPEALKTLRFAALSGSVNLHCNEPSQDTAMAVALYGSRNIARWLLLASSASPCVKAISGSPYRFFRFAAAGRIRPKDSISALYTSHIIKYNSRPR